MNTKLENVSLIEDYNGWITGSDGVRSENQMVRLHACRVVTGMPDAARCIVTFPRKRNTVGDGVRNAMRILNFSADAEASVTVLVFRCLPLPAAICLFHLRPEPIF